MQGGRDTSKRKRREREHRHRERRDRDVFVNKQQRQSNIRTVHEETSSRLEYFRQVRVRERDHHVHEITSELGRGQGSSYCFEEKEARKREEERRKEGRKTILRNC